MSTMLPSGWPEKTAGAPRWSSRSSEKSTHENCIFADQVDLCHIVVEELDLKADIILITIKSYKVLAENYRASLIIIFTVSNFYLV